MEAVRMVCAAGMLLAAGSVHAQEDTTVSPDECRQYRDIVCEPEAVWCQDVQAACARQETTAPMRIALFPLVTGDRVPKAIAEACSSALITVAHVDTSATILTVEDAEERLGFSPLQAVAACGDDALCLAQIGGVLEVSWLVVGRIARTSRGTRYEAVVMRVDVARATITARTMLDLFGTREEIERGFADGIRTFFGDDVVHADRDAPAAPPPPHTGEHTEGGMRPTAELPPTSIVPRLPVPSFIEPDAMPSSDSGVRALVISGWSSAALGVVAGGLGAWQGVVALNQQEAYAHARTQIDALDAKSAGEQAGLAANIAYASCGALIATAIVLFITDAMDDDSDPRDP